MKLAMLSLTLIMSKAAIAAPGAVLEPSTPPMGRPGYLTVCVSPTGGIKCPLEQVPVIVSDPSGCRVVCAPSTDEKAPLNQPSYETIHQGKSSPAKHYQDDLDEQAGAISKLAAGGDLTGMSQKLNSLFDNSASGAAAGPVAIGNAQSAAVETGMKEAVNEAETGTSLRPVNDRGPSPEPCPRRPWPPIEDRRRFSTTDCDPVPRPWTDRSEGNVSLDKAHGRVLLAQVSESDVDNISHTGENMAKLIRDWADNARKDNEAGERAAREGAEKQRAAEREWEGQPRNYPQYER